MARNDDDAEEVSQETILSRFRLPRRLPPIWCQARKAWAMVVTWHNPDVMHESFRGRKRYPILTTTSCFLAMLSLNVPGPGSGQVSEASARVWRADHHMHLASAQLCRLVGECLPSNDPPAVFANDAVHALDQTHVAKGVILSCAYLYGLPSLHLSPQAVATMTRRENEFTAEQVAQYPARLVGFLSVSPLKDSAIEEIQHWQGRRQLIGLKLHFTASAVHMRNAAERRKVARVIGAAAAEHLPIVIHIGGGKFNAADAELFIRDLLPRAGDSLVQIGHAGGGLPRGDGNNLAVLRAFGDHIVRDDLATRRVLFDISYVPAPATLRKRRLLWWRK
jgi:predicted TIM-barrel fold metal-dependent hydrolase